MMNPGASQQYNPYGSADSQSVASVHWRSGLTREQRQELISKMYDRSLMR